MLAPMLTAKTFSTHPPPPKSWLGLTLEMLTYSCKTRGLDISLLVTFQADKHNCGINKLTPQRLPSYQKRIERQKKHKMCTIFSIFHSPAAVYPRNWYKITCWLSKIPEEGERPQGLWETGKFLEEGPCSKGWLKDGQQAANLYYTHTCIHTYRAQNKRGEIKISTL